MLLVVRGLAGKTEVRGSSCAFRAVSIAKGDWLRGLGRGVIKNIEEYKEKKVKFHGEYD